MIKMAAVWILGLVTLVPYGVYHLLFHAQRDEYALLITLILFWMFGFWAVVGPTLSALKVRRVFRALESSQSSDQLRKVIQSADSREVAIDLIASENGIPKALAKRIYDLALKRFAEAQPSP